MSGLKLLNENLRIEESDENAKTNLLKHLRKAEEFHGHLGPFLVIGVRIGLMGIRELKTTKGDRELCVTAMVRNSIPFSCVLDGIQMVTSCTIGNGRLKLRESSQLAAKFEKRNRRRLAITVNPRAIEKLRNELSTENASSAVRELAYRVASIPEQKLFVIER